MGVQFFPWFKMIFWDVFTDVLLHSQGHFDSFACDSCQFPGSTPHLLKTLEKQKKQIKKQEKQKQQYF